MDPNETLARLREAIATAQRGLNSGEWSNDTEIQTLWEITELAAALDGWISRGGFLPDAWARDDRPPLETAQEALTQALTLALTAIGPQKADQAAALADRLAIGMSADMVEKAKGDALYRARAQQLRAQLDQEPDPFA